jgi:hypothetical protein
MTISKVTEEEEFDAVLYGDSEEGTLIEDKITGDGRWVDYHYAVWSEKHDDETYYFGYSYDVPSTEVQEGSESEFNASEIHEVFPRSVVVTKYYNKTEVAKIDADRAALPTKK